jgi:adenine-specific DNA-methyltransferase
MARIHELLAQLRASAPTLASDIEREVDVLADRRAFGLNFERHTPEAVELPGRKVRPGDKVRIQPPRGEMPTVANRSLYRVTTIVRDGAGRVAKLADLHADTSEGSAGLHAVDVDDLVVVAEFRDPIYPGLVSTGKVERGDDKPFHSVINAENFHALQTLLFTHRGKVDAIYIDPPYNTGAKDWKYNNDYVEGDDLYRHSKWLAFMERRLLLARELLNPRDSILIVTIDEKEYLRLGLLLEQSFPEAEIQMVSDVINPSGSSRRNMFSRSDEYIFFVFMGEAALSETWDDMLNAARSEGSLEVRWDSLMRRGENGRRERRPNLFYPLYFDAATGEYVEYGPALPQGQVEAPVKLGLIAELPVRDDGAEMTWGVSGDVFGTRLRSGYVRHYRNTSGRLVVRVLQSGTIEEIESGLIERAGKDEMGFDKFIYVASKTVRPMTTWHRGSHSASDYGTPMLSALVPRRRFPFPKSLYAVEDSLRFAVASKPRAVIVDFFSGSGTTAHAVMRLNKQDGGRRVSISVTNNEVSAAEQNGLRSKGLRPGDSEWESWGICDHITKPRLRAAITGATPEGPPVAGSYRFVDEFPMSDGLQENVEFFTLTYESPMRVQSNREFARIAPFLWLRAGSKGRRIESLEAGWDVADTYGVLADLDQTEPFLASLFTSPEARLAFVVTDEDRLFQAVVRDLPGTVEPVRMYESYLRNFEIDAMRSVR